MAMIYNATVPIYETVTGEENFVICAGLGEHYELKRAHSSYEDSRNSSKIDSMNLYVTKDGVKGLREVVELTGIANSHTLNEYTNHGRYVFSTDESSNRKIMLTGLKTICDEEDLGEPMLVDTYFVKKVTCAIPFEGKKLNNGVACKLVIDKIKLISLGEGDSLLVLIKATEGGKTINREVTHFVGGQVELIYLSNLYSDSTSVRITVEGGKNVAIELSGHTMKSVDVTEDSEEGESN